MKNGVQSECRFVHRHVATTKEGFQRKLRPTTEPIFGLGCEISELMNAIDAHSVRRCTARYGVASHLNPPAALRVGGTHEVMIKAGKHTINVILGNSDITDIDVAHSDLMCRSTDKFQPTSIRQ